MSPASGVSQMGQAACPWRECADTDPMTLYLILLCLFFVAVCLWAEQRRAILLIGFSKSAASLCFVYLAWHQGAMETHFSRLIFAGLILSLLGDVFLLSARRFLFLGGMAAFGLAHVAYTAGFLRLSPFPSFAWAVGAGLTILFMGGVMVRLWPSLLTQWRVPVAAYTIIIGAMVATALAGGIGGQLALPFAAAALAFAVSDISVARDRLTASDPGSRIWGLPLYYAAQLLFAASL